MAPRKSATEAVKKELEKREEVKVEVPVPTEEKSRCDFNNWEEYWSYKGPKK